MCLSYVNNLKIVSLNNKQELLKMLHLLEAVFQINKSNLTINHTHLHQMAKRAKIKPTAQILTTLSPLIL